MHRAQGGMLFGVFTESVMTPVAGAMICASALA
jgi:hypothetical protein